MQYRRQKSPTSELTVLDLKSTVTSESTTEKKKNKGNFHSLTQKKTLSKAGDAKAFTRAGRAIPLL